MKSLLLLLCAMAAAGWAQDVDVEFDEAVDFAKFKTFRLMDGNLNTKAPLLNNDLTRKKIESEIRLRLTGKKLTEVTSGRPDLAVRYALGAVRSTDTNVIRGRRGRVVGAVKSQTAEGMLTIDLLDGTSRDLLWRAVAVEEERDPAKLQDRLDEMVKKSFDKYPPKK
jgi:hypothetical protein